VQNSVDVLVGKRVRVRRLELSLSQTELAEKIGVTFQQVQKYERGANRISCSRLTQIASALEVKLAYFFGEDAWGNGRAGMLDAIDIARIPEGQNCCLPSWASRASPRGPRQSSYLKASPILQSDVQLRRLRNELRGEVSARPPRGGHSLRPGGRRDNP
jgi:DNA-binding XRE family transcriptional regulator